MTDLTPALLVIIGGLITGLTTLGVEWFKSSGVRNLDNAQRKDNRQLARDNYQREVLTTLQREVIDLTRITVDFMDARVGESQTRGAIEVLAEQRLQLYTRVAAGWTNVDDSELRDMLDTLTDELEPLDKAMDEESAAEARQKGPKSLQPFLIRSGALIRATYVDPSERTAILKAADEEIARGAML